MAFSWSKATNTFTFTFKLRIYTTKKLCQITKIIRDICLAQDLHRFLNVKAPAGAQTGEGPSRGLLCDCETSNFAKVRFQASVECMTPRQPRIKRVFSGYCFSGNKKTNIFIIYLNQTILLQLIFAIIDTEGSGSQYTQVSRAAKSGNEIREEGNAQLGIEVQKINLISMVTY